MSDPSTCIVDLMVWTFVCTKLVVIIKDKSNIESFESFESFISILENKFRLPPWSLLIIDYKKHEQIKHTSVPISKIPHIVIHIHSCENFSQSVCPSFVFTGAIKSLFNLFPPHAVPCRELAGAIQSWSWEPAPGSSLSGRPPSPAWSGSPWSWWQPFLCTRPPAPCVHCLGAWPWKRS